MRAPDDVSDPKVISPRIMRGFLLLVGGMRGIFAGWGFGGRGGWWGVGGGIDNEKDENGKMLMRERWVTR